MSMNGNDGHLSHDAAAADIPHEWVGTRVEVILADITNVVGHRIMRTPGLAAHRIDFASGGVARILFTCDGLLQQFES